MVIFFTYKTLRYIIIRVILMYFNENNYDYDKMVSDIEKLSVFGDIKVKIIGKSVLSKNIYCLKIGHGKKNICYIGTHHSLEWISASLLMKFSYCILNSANSKTRYLSYSISELLQEVTFHIMPMLNPDGIDIINNKIVDHTLYEKLIEWNKGDDFSFKWQANANGVDLNHNYDAGFEKAKALEQKYGVKGPSNTRYGGPYPESEPEVKSLCDYIRQTPLSLLITYHSQGEVIYYDYNSKVPKNSKELGKILSRKTGYTLDNVEGIASFGGCKDWFIDKFNKPAYTVELGKGKNPLNFSQFDKIFNDNIESMILLPFIC